MVTAGSRGAAERAPSSLGELLLTFSTVTSVGLGFGTDHGIRTCYVGVQLGADLELSSERIADLYYAALAKDAGCTCGASQMADFLGADEREAIADLVQRDTANEIEMLRWLFRYAGRGSGPASRARRTIGALVHGARFDREASLAECEVAQRVATRLGLGEEAALALTACTERWDGKGQPHGLAGDAIPLVARVINLGAAVQIADRFSGRDAAIELVRRGSGKAFDPRVARAFLGLAERPEFWAGFDDEEHLGERVLALEPIDGRLPGGIDALDRFTEALADLVDFKRPATAGHARRVAERSRRLGERLGLSGPELATLRRAALVHDVGLMAISARDLATGRNGMGYRTHPLGPVQLLDGVPALRAACELAALHHERMYGSGWPAGASASRQPAASRILAAVCALDEASKGAPAVPVETLSPRGPSRSPPAVAAAWRLEALVEVRTCRTSRAERGGLARESTDHDHVSTAATSKGARFPGASREIDDPPNLAHIHTACHLTPPREDSTGSEVGGDVEAATCRLASTLDDDGADLAAAMFSTR